MNRRYFHLHLVSDSTGETLLAVSRAVAAQYEGISAIEHVYPLVRSDAQLDRALVSIVADPGIVLYTLVNEKFEADLNRVCKEESIPILSVLGPVKNIFQSYLGIETTARPGAQHMLNADYFKRIDAMNYTLSHDDGQIPQDLNAADVILVGVSRTSKTPTAIYLANRGIKTANVPTVPGIPLPETIEKLKNPLIVGLVANPDRIVQIRQNRLLSLNVDENTSYVDRDAVAAEIAESRKLCARHGWPVIDVTRRSIEETAAAILELLQHHKAKMTETS